MVGITQRVDVAHGTERRDALDQEWARIVVELGRVPLPLPNRGLQAGELFERFDIDSLILTGGNDLGSAPERDALEIALLGEARQRGLPVLAVCRGFQLVNVHLGGSIRRVEGHVRATHEVRDQGGAAWARVNSFHDFAIDDLAADLTPLLGTDDGTIEAASHADLPWLCVMWHPERANAEPGLHRRLVAGALAAEARLPTANFKPR